MNVSETRRLEMLQRVVTFGEAHRDLFPADTVGGQALDIVGGAVKQLGEDVVSQTASAGGGRRAKTAAREALLSQLDAIVRSARVMAADQPEFDDPFRLPVPRTDPALVATGRAFVREAEAAKSKFLAYGLADSFIGELQQLVDDFERAIRSREERKGGRAAARARIDTAFSTAIDALRKLDVIVINRLRHDPVTRAVWEKGRKIEPVRRPRTVKAEPAPVVVETDVEADAA